MRIIIMSLTCLLVCLFSLTTLLAQKHPPKKYNSLFQYGIADAFVAGLYKGGYPVGLLKDKGDFGVGAPDLLDGEFTVYKGKVYQTKATGQTIVAPDSLTTSLMFVCFFHPDTSFHITSLLSQKEALQQIDNYLTNRNGLYAIRITGHFNHIKTRAFPPIASGPEPFPVLSTMLDKQHFFEFNDTKGVLVGYKMPSYLGGINIEGFHFHFLSEDLKGGGHVLDFSPVDVTIEIGVMKDIQLQVPTDKAFGDFNFKGANRSDLDKVERGH